MSRSQYGRADDTWSLDSFKLHRAGRLEPGSWGEVRPGLVLTVKEHCVIVSYNALFADGSRKQIGEAVSIVHSRRHFGGSVTYFICPAEGCGRRVSKLYVSSGRLRCRVCSALKYTCQYENLFDRTLRRREKLGHKLGIDLQNTFTIIQKPKKMRRKVFERLIVKFDELENRFEN